MNISKKEINQLTDKIFNCQSMQDLNNLIYEFGEKQEDYCLQGLLLEIFNKTRRLEEKQMY
jgi:hypothetical protein